MTPYEQAVKARFPHAHIMSGANMGTQKFRVENAKAPRKKRPLGPWRNTQDAAWQAAAHQQHLLADQP